MRALAAFVAAIFGTLLLAALVAWPAWLAAHALVPEWPFHRVVGRLWQLLLLVALVLACRRLGLRGRDDWGYGIPRRAFLREAGAGFALGLATMLPMTAAMFALGIRALRPEFSAGLLLEGVASGLLAGLFVAVIEETFFRGLMYRAVSRESGFAAAAACTAVVYAALHFLARARIPADEVEWTSGLELLGATLGNLVHPLAVVDSFTALVLVGLLLALVRRRTGAIAACIGLHMGWVCVIKATTTVSREAAGAEWSFLVSDFDGYTGWMVAGWATLLIAVARWRGWLGRQ
jgi:membrane protease YdiL (CAAX protease family)